MSGLHALAPAASVRTLLVVLALVLWPQLSAGSAPVGEPERSRPATRDLLRDLRAGHWIEVRGAWRAATNRFEAERLEVRAPQAHSEIWGVAEISSGDLRILGRRVSLRRGTEWKGSSENLAHLVHQRVRVLGDVGPQRVFVADEVDLRKPGVDRLVGRVDRVRRLGAVLEIEVLGFLVAVPTDVRQRVRAGDDETFDLTSSAWTAPARPLRSASVVWEDPDDFLGRGWRISDDVLAQLRQEVVFSSQRNPELDARDDLSDEDRDDLAHQLRARVSWSPNSRVSGVLDLSHRVRRREPSRGDDTTQGQLQLREGWVLFRDVGLGFDVQVGRQDFDEPREWLFDDNLDGIRLYRRLGPVLVQASVSRSLDLDLESVSSRNQDATNQILYVSNVEGPRHYAAYVVRRDFGTERDELASHQGVRAFGRFGPQARFWSEWSLLTGDRAGREVEAWGGDFGLSWRARGRFRPTLTVGWALGRGDDGNGVDRRFRQTGLQDNNGRVGGDSFVRYYGELMNPELSNLRISTLGVGFELGRGTTFELIAHHYRQDVPSRRLTNTDLERRPNGVDPELGWEFDGVLSVRRFGDLDIEVVGAWFRHGAGFASDDAEDATLVRLQFRYRF